MFLTCHCFYLIDLKVSESALSYAPPNNSPAYIIMPAESSIPPGSILLNPHTGTHTHTLSHNSISITHNSRVEADSLVQNDCKATHHRIFLIQLWICLLGQPFLNPDGTPAVYNPPVSQMPCNQPCNQLNPVQSQAPPPPPQQQPVASHGIPQVNKTYNGD